MVNNMSHYMRVHCDFKTKFTKIIVQFPLIKFHLNKVMQIAGNVHFNGHF